MRESLAAANRRRRVLAHRRNTVNRHIRSEGSFLRDAMDVNVDALDGRWYFES